MPIILRIFQTLLKFLSHNKDLVLLVVLAIVALVWRAKVLRIIQKVREFLLNKNPSSVFSSIKNNIS